MSSGIGFGFVLIGGMTSSVRASRLIAYGQVPIYANLPVGVKQRHWPSASCHGEGAL